MRAPHVARHERFSELAQRARVWYLSRMNRLISLLFNFTVKTLGFKKTTDKTHTRAQSQAQSFIRMACTINHPRARMTHRRFICFKCPPQIQSLSLSLPPKKEKNPTNCWAAPSSALPLFLQGLKKRPPTSHPSCDGFAGRRNSPRAIRRCSFNFPLPLSCASLCGTCRYCHFPR